MIIKSIKQNKNDYTVKIDDFIVNLSEDVIVKFNLYVNKNIDEKVYYELTLANDYSVVYNLAFNYAVKYNKSKRAVYLYLLNKDYPSFLCEEITEELTKKGIINDFKIAEGLTISYYKKGNGRHLIRAKLEAQFISSKAIDAAINKIDFDDYLEYMKRYAQKYYDKINKFDEYQRLMKTKEYLKKHGYTYDEIAYYKQNI